MTHLEASQILYLALAEPIGLFLRTSSSTQAKARLYQARIKLGDPALAGLQIRTSPIEGGDLILVKGTIQLPKVKKEESEVRPNSDETLEEMGL